MMTPIDAAWSLLKADRQAYGMYRQATIPDDKTKPVTKVSHNTKHHPFANRFGTLALSHALASMGKPVVPEKPIRGGAVEQEQMDGVFGGLTGMPDDYSGRGSKIKEMAEDPIMRLLGLRDLKPANTGMHDSKVKVFDPSYGRFNGISHAAPLSVEFNEVNGNFANDFQDVPDDELNQLSQGVKNYRPNLDVWDDTGDLRSWQKNMSDYKQANDTLQYLNSLRQDPQQTKLFEHEGFAQEFRDDPRAYSNFVQQLRGE